MHNWILVDIIEEYEGKENDLLPIIENVFVGHKYMIGCYTCDSLRIVREDTFNKMVILGLIEEVSV